MPAPPSPPVWTINASGVQPGTNGFLLVGCHITMNDDETAYEFTQPAIQQVLATSSGTTLPLTFPTFNYNTVNGWTIELKTAVVQGNATGKWRTPATPRIEDTPAQSGDFTAQTGGAVAPDEAAASAVYGKS